MKASPRVLNGLIRRITLGSMGAAALGALGALVAGLLILKPVEGTSWKLAVLIAGIFPVIALWRLSVESQRTKTVRALGRGERSPDRSLLLEALRELVSLSDRSFWTNVSTFLWGGAFTGVAYHTWTDASWSLSLQIFFLALTMGLTSALHAHVLLVPRVREGALLLMDVGLSQADALPELSARRRTVRQRIIILTSIGALAPSAVIAQLYLSRTDVVLDSLEANVGMTGMAAVELGVWGAVGVSAFIVWVLFIAWTGASSIALPMQEMARQASQIADGDLRPMPLVLAEDEVWTTSKAFIQMRMQLMNAVAELKRAGIKITGATDALVKTSDEHGSGTQQQVSSLNETSVTTEELARSAIEIAHRASSVAEIAKKTLQVAVLGQTTAEAFFGSMAQMKKDNHAIADAVVKLNKRVQQIGKIVEFINEIADKADLLALNAELEGTKAGDVGRGFSLVAAEMRRLAESVITSTREIASLINDIRDATNAAVMATEAGVKATDAGATISLQVAQSLRTIVELAQQTSDAVQTISLATQQQQTGTGQLAEAMSSVLNVTQQGALATEQMTSANADLAGLAKDLQSAVGRFQIN
jgi:methyl-accepting chemotaxis protein